MSKSEVKKYECTLCTENMIDNDRIICPHCSIEICESCFQYSITMELQDPVCIYCKKSISIEFILSNNKTIWCEKVFLEYYSNLLLEKEKNKLMDTFPKYKKHLQINELKKERNNLDTNKKIMNSLKKLKLSKDEVNLKYNHEILLRNIKKEEINDKIYEIEKSLNIKKEKKEKISYITKCPNDKCKGFINNKYKCELCETEICKACFMIKDNDHTCKRDDIESADLIKKDSKPCPGCYVSIFKISGCNQMFCTNCKTVFHWETLKIDNGAVHNQHYFDYIAQLRNSSDQIRIENAACGNIEELYPRIMKYTRRSFIHQIYLANQELNADIIPSLRNCFKDNFENYRIEFLCNKLSEQNWKKKIVKDTIANEANYSYIEIHEMFVTITSDLIRKLCFELDTILIEKEKKFKEVIIGFFQKYILQRNPKDPKDLNDEYFSFNLKLECEKNDFYINRDDIHLLYHLIKTRSIDWYDNDILNHNIFNDIDINIIKFSEIDFDEYYLNFKTFFTHFRSCMKNTYQTFGQRINKNISTNVIDNLITI